MSDGDHEEQSWGSVWDFAGPSDVICRFPVFICTQKFEHCVIVNEGLFFASLSSLAWCNC